MRLGLVTPFFLLLLSTLAAAQDTQPFVGKWKVSWQADKGVGQGRLVIAANGGGTWKAYTKSRYDNCVGLEVPIALEDVGADKVTVVLKFSEKLTGCADSRFRWQKTDADHMVGKREERDVTAMRD